MFNIIEAVPNIWILPKYSRIDGLKLSANLKTFYLKLFDFTIKVPECYTFFNL